MTRPKLAIVLGIRPDVIRASLVLNALRSRDDIDVTFIWSGQHYSDNLKDIFFRELDVAPPEIELGAGGSTDAEISSQVIARLFPVLEDLEPDAVVFLGDTNTVMGCLAVTQQNIPLVHIEGCMRAYDWRMPEEKCRTTIDHLSDVIYTYFDEYKAQGVAEGLNPASIVVVQNLIVDVLDHYYYKRKGRYDEMATESVLPPPRHRAGRVLPGDVPPPGERREPVQPRERAGPVRRRRTARSTSRPATGRSASSRTSTSTCRPTCSWSTRSGTRRCSC